MAPNSLFCLNFAQTSSVPIRAWTRLFFGDRELQATTEGKIKLREPLP